MAETVTETIATLLESAIDETDDGEVRFKLRTALQLLFVVEDRRDRAVDTLEDAELERDLRDRLRELGYIE